MTVRVNARSAGSLTGPARRSIKKASTVCIAQTADFMKKIVRKLTTRERKIAHILHAMFLDAFGNQRQVY